MTHPCLALHDDNDVTGVTNVVEEPDTDILADILKSFSKQDQVKVGTVRRFQHVAGFPSNSTIIHSVITNRIKIVLLHKEIQKCLKRCLDLVGMQLRVNQLGLSQIGYT